MKWNVTIQLIVGYRDDDSEILKNVNYEVEAETEQAAINKASELDKSLYSVYDVYADAIED